MVQRAGESAADPTSATRDPDNTPPDPDSNLPFTKPQRDTYDAQQRDENRWVYHPAIDGCVPLPPRDSDLLH